jgi:hypothetical protein
MQSAVLAGRTIKEEEMLTLIPEPTLNTPTSAGADAEESGSVDRSSLQVIQHSAHITACLEGHMARVHHFRDNHAEVSMDSMDSHSTEKPNFVRSGAAMLT